MVVGLTDKEISRVNIACQNLQIDLHDALDVGKGKFAYLSCRDANELMVFCEDVEDWAYLNEPHSDNKWIVSKLDRLGTDITDYIPVVIIKAIEKVRKQGE